MNIFEKYAKHSKREIFDLYESIVSHVKEIDELSSSEMLESITNEYKKDLYVYYICTHMELDFLKKLFNNEITADNRIEYKWEITELSKKLIIDEYSLKLYDFQEENVSKALKHYEEYGVDFLEDIVKILIGIVRTYIIINKDELYEVINSLLGLKKKDLEELEEHPLFHFYCGIMIADIDLIYYKKYFNNIDLCLQKRKDFKINFNLDYQDYLDMFRYGFNIKNDKVKKMYEYIQYDDKLYNTVEYARLFDDREKMNYTVSNKQDNRLLNEGLDNSLIAIYNGFSSADYKQ